MATIYLASPTGFSPEMWPYRQAVKKKLVEQGHVVLDPWDEKYEQQFASIARIKHYDERIHAYRALAVDIGWRNHVLLLKSDVVLGIVDGTEPDSGTVGEMCYGAGKGKRVYGLRTDFRDSGDMPGIPINLQVLFFIEETGGCLFRSVDAIGIPG